MNPGEGSGLAQRLPHRLSESVRRERVAQLLERFHGRRAHAPVAVFDPLRAEAELYDALYGARTGTVDNIVPLVRPRERAQGSPRGSRAAHRARPTPGSNDAD